MKSETKDTRQTDLQTIDEQIKTATGGASDLYGLLATLASQTLGIPRAAFTPPKPEPPKDWGEGEGDKPLPQQSPRWE
jgi:hypothetical protein